MYLGRIYLCLSNGLGEKKTCNIYMHPKLYINKTIYIYVYSFCFVFVTNIYMFAYTCIHVCVYVYICVCVCISKLHRPNGSYQV